MQSICCTSSNFFVLNADFLKLDDVSPKAILNSFTLKNQIAPRQIFKNPAVTLDFPIFKTYDLFYSLEKKEGFKRLINRVSKEQLKEYLKFTFVMMFGIGLNKNVSLLESIHEFFSDEVINRTRAKIEGDMVTRQTQTKEEIRAKTQLKKDDKLRRKISKQKREPKRTMKAISHSLNRPYHQIRLLLKAGRTNQRSEDILQRKSQLRSKRIEAVKLFHTNFRRYQEDFMTINQMFDDMRARNEFCRDMSRSHFYKFFVRQQGFVFVKPKLKHSMFQVARKQESRYLTTFLLYKIIHAKHVLLFYDETTIQMTKSGFASWFHRTDAKEKQIRVTNQFLKLNLVTSMTKLISLCITFDSFDSQDVSHLINRTCIHLSENEAKGQEIFVVMDNAPKNRAKFLTELCENGPYRIVMTTPTTPQHNFAESIFFFVKKRVERRNFCRSQGRQNESKEEMVHQVLEVLRSLDEEVFISARRMFLNDLQSTLD